MIKLTTNYKIDTARKLTELAIENNLISMYSDETDTATAICDFFKTIYEKLDSEELDSEE